MESIQQKLSALDKKSETLVQEGKYLEALDTMEEALNTRRNFFGETSDEYYKTAEKLCELCNMLSMIFLQKEKFEATLEFLKKAEVLAQNSLELKAVTFNNLACYYRRIGKLRIALKYLEDAITIETKLDKSKTLADTHLNICAVHSQLGKHDVAMVHIMKSIILLQDELLSYSLSPPQDDSEQSRSNRMSGDKKKQFEDRVAVLAIAYHNLGVEHEYLKQYPDAILTYKKAVNFARAHLGEESQVAKNLQSVLDTACNQIEDIKNKTKQKKTGKPAFEKSNTTTGRFKQAANVYSKEGPKSDTKRYSYGGNIDSAYQAENQAVVDTYTKQSQPVSGELVSASSGFTPLRKEDQHLGKKDNNAKQVTTNYSYDDSQDQVKRTGGHQHSVGSNVIEESLKEETYHDESKAEGKDLEASDHY